MRIVLDANIIIAALMGSRGKLTILTSQNYEFYAPKFIIQEIKKYKNEICERTDWTSEEFNVYFDALLLFIDVLDYEQYQDYIDNAKKVIQDRDLKDVDYIACALSTKADFIWSDDKDFSEQQLVKIKTTDEFIEENK